MAQWLGEKGGGEEVKAEAVTKAVTKPVRRAFRTRLADGVFASSPITS